MSGAAGEEDGFRIEIDEQWSASEFAELFSEMEFLYKIAAFGEVRYRWPIGGVFRSLPPL
jgi:hypothetical protein